MPSFDPLETMTAIAALSYFMGIYLHYLHVRTIFHLLDRFEELNKTKAMFQSITWPITVLVMMWEEAFGRDEED